MSAQKKTGLFFGFFNPIHVGHLIIAGHLISDAQIEELWMVVSPQNPLKDKKSLANDYDRLRMVEMAIGENIAIKASNIEFALPKPSYTIDTLTYLREKYPHKTFVLVMGGDNIHSINKWKNWESLISDYEIIVYNRPGNAPELPDFVAGTHNIRFVDAPLLDISSSYIRQRIADKKEFRYMVTDAVYNYITDNHLYKQK